MIRFLVYGACEVYFVATVNVNPEIYYSVHCRKPISVEKYTRFLNDLHPIQCRLVFDISAPRVDLSMVTNKFLYKLAPNVECVIQLNGAQCGVKHALIFYQITGI